MDLAAKAGMMLAMGRRWWRNPWSLLVLIVVVPALAFGIRALLPCHPQSENPQIATV